MHNVTEIFYYNRGYTPSLIKHKHPFYQLEYCISGKRLSQREDERFMMKEGDIWLIPSGVMHHFPSNSNSNCVYFTIKFMPHHAVPEFHGQTPLIHYYLKQLLSVIDESLDFLPSTEEQKIMIENALENILNCIEQMNIPSEDRETPFLMRLREYVCENKYAVNVSEIAQAFGLTRSQLQYRFAKENGGNQDIKSMIDEIIIKMSNQHLIYSSMSIMQIAEELNFPSVYAFSRFYKRKVGISPQTTRKQSVQCLETKM